METRSFPPETFPLFIPMKPFLTSLLSAAALSTAVQGQIENLVITEFQPSTSQVEVTNIGDTTVAATNSMRFCYRIRYSAPIPAGESFAPGQSRVYTIPNLPNQTSSDFWLYSEPSYNSPDALLNGFKWGSADSLGRTSVAIRGGDWEFAEAFVPAPAADESIQLTPGSDPSLVASWTLGTPNFGDFEQASVAGDGELAVSITAVGDTIELSWQGGNPPYQVLTTSDLSLPFSPLGELTADLSLTLPRAESGRQFFAVRDSEPTATFEITLRSTWSSFTHTIAPPNARFSAVTGTTHNSDVSFWSPGAIASGGIEQKAESANASAFLSEISAAVSAGSADAPIAAAAIPEPFASTTTTVVVNRTHPLITVVSRMEDTSDWFTGVQGFSVLDESGAFIDSVEIPLMPWDAGTDSGDGFQPATAANDLSEPIRSLSGSPAFRPSPLLQSDEETLPVGALTIRRVRNEL